MVDAQIGMGLGFRLGVKGHAEVGSLQHRDVVGTVADGNGTAAVLRGKLRQNFGFGLSVNHAAEYAPGKFAARHFQFVGKGVFKAEPRFEAVGEKGEAAGHQHERHLVFVAFLQQIFRAVGEFERVGINGVQAAFGNAFQQGDATAQRLFEIQLAAHGTFGNFGHLRFQTRLRGNFVNAFNGDERAVHIADNQPHIAAERQIGQHGKIGAGCLQFAADFIVQLRIGRHGNAGECGLAMLRQRKPPLGGGQ